MPPTLFQKLVARPAESDAVISALSPASSDARREALRAMEQLARHFIEPAHRWLTPSADDPTHRFIDLDRAAGMSISGLLAGLLARKLPTLTPPSEVELAEAMRAAGIEIPNSQQRAEFHAAWTAQRASRIVRALLRVVSENVPNEPATNAAEIAALKKLAETSLPTVEQSLIADIVRRRLAA